MALKRYVVGGIGVLLIGWSTGIINPGALDVPIWWRLVVTSTFFALLAGAIAAAWVRSREPDDDEDGIYLLAFMAHEDGGGLFELTEEDYADLKVHGTLHAWDHSPKRVYECRYYDKQTNTAIANWRETDPDSKIAAQPTIEDAMAEIYDIRKNLEPDARKARELQRRIRGIVRQLDRERAKAQRETLDNHVAPSIGNSKSISEIVESELPDDLIPPTMKNELEDADPRDDESTAGPDVEILDETEALEPVTDGGEDSE